jgi:hypothetical protein
MAEATGGQRVTRGASPIGIFEHGDDLVPAGSRGSLDFAYSVNSAPRSAEKRKVLSDLGDLQQRCTPEMVFFKRIQPQCIPQL